MVTAFQLILLIVMILSFLGVRSKQNEISNIAMFGISVTAFMVSVLYL